MNALDQATARWSVAKDKLYQLRKQKRFDAHYQDQVKQAQREYEAACDARAKARTTVDWQSF